MGAEKLHDMQKWTKIQIIAVQEAQRELQEFFTTDPCNALHWLQVYHFMHAENNINLETITSKQKTKVLLKIFTRLDGGWIALHLYLNANKGEIIVRQLLTIEKRLYDENSAALSGHIGKADVNGVFSVTRSEHSREDLKILQFQSELKDWTARHCEWIRKQWENAVGVQELEHSFVRVNYADDFGVLTWTRKDLDDYKFLFGLEKRIVISGHPGAGKSMFVTNVVYDWAVGRRASLCEHFHFIFVLPLSQAEGGTLADAICNKLGFGDRDLIDTLLAFPNQKWKTMVMFDAYDELNAKSFPTMNRIVSMRVHSALKCVITTRPSHVDRLRNHLWLSIQGFNDAERMRYIERQLGTPIGPESPLNIAASHHAITRKPILLAIACSLIKVQEEAYFKRNPAPDGVLFELIRSYYKWLAWSLNKKLETTVPQATFDEAMIEAGKLAFHQVIKVEQCNPRAEFPLVINYPNVLRLQEAVQFGLLTVDSRPGDPKLTSQRFLFLHRIFAEYLCAVAIVHHMPHCSTTRHRVAHQMAACLNLQASSVSYFLTGLSNVYFQAVATRFVHSAANSNDNYQILQLPWVCGYQKLDNSLLATCPFYKIDCTGIPVAATALLCAAAEKRAENRECGLYIVNAAFDLNWTEIFYMLQELHVVSCTIPENPMQAEMLNSCITRLYLVDCRVRSFLFLQQTRLRVLMMENCVASDHAWLELAAALKGRQVHEMLEDLWLAHIIGHSNALMEKVFASVLCVPNLRKLTIICVPFTEKMASCLETASTLNTLGELGINGLQFSETAGAKLFRSIAQMKRLQTLRVQNTKLDDDLLRILLSSTSLAANLIDLHLAGCVSEIEVATVAKKAKKAFQSLTGLHVRGYAPKVIFTGESCWNF